MMQALLADFRLHRPILFSPWRQPLRGASLWLALSLCVPAISAAQSPDGKTELSPTAASASPKSPASAEEIRAVVAELDSDDYDTRCAAAERLVAWTAQPAAQAPLAEILQALLVDPATSFEVRATGESILARLNPLADKPAAPVDLAEIDRLISLTDADSYSVRAGAAVRLGWLAKQDAKFAVQLTAKLKPRLSEPDLSPERRERLTSIWKTARGVWLTSDPASWPRADVSDKQLEAWVDDLQKPSVDLASRLVVERAERELLDLMAHDDQVSRVRVAIERRIPMEAAKAATPMPVVLRSPLDFVHQQAEFEADDRLQRLHEWTKPAMVAEIWYDHTHETIQYLQIDVPQFNERATIPRATHFDRIDDKTAHCVSGNSLAPGEYPVGIALPPTSTSPDVPKSGRAFHLINLSTPRRRLVYENYHLKIDEPRRLAELSERTTAWLLAQKRTLTEREILMLAQLDPVVVSRFVGPYLASADDAPRTDLPDDYPMLGRESRHALLCLMLSEIGTHECLPGLVDAIRRGRIEGPKDRVAYHFGWLAALSIAERDPWPGVDDWLASLIEVSDAVQTARTAPPEVGATAAAMLLIRHGASVSEFGLVEFVDGQLAGMNFQLCRFSAPERRQQVLQWWKQHRPKTPAA